MKRSIFLWALLLSLLLGACAVSGNGEETVTVYYCAEDGGMDCGCAAVRSEQTVPAGSDHLHEALRLIAEEPETAKLHSAFPNGLRIETYSLENGDISVGMSRGYSALRPIEQTMVRACLVLTLCSLREVDSVSLYEEETLLESGLTEADFLRDSLQESGTQTELTLWLPDTDRGCLVGEDRAVRQWGNVSMAESVLRQTLVSLQPYGVPKETQVLSAAQKNGVCTVDLSAEFREVSELRRDELRLLVYSIVNTLTELDSIETVQFRCEGSSMGVCGAMDLSGAFAREEGFTAPAMEDEANLTQTVYLLGADGLLVPVTAAFPVKDREYSAVEASVRALLELDHSWGYQLPFIPGTELMSCTVRDGAADLVLGETFWSGGEPLRELTASALAATACDAGQLQGIRIMTLSGVYRNRELLTNNGDRIGNG